MNNDNLVEYDPVSDEFADFALFAWDALLDAVSPMEDCDFWRHVESLDWGNNHERFDELSEQLAKRVSLVNSLRVFLAALDWTEKLEDLFSHPDIDVSGEDSQEDFLYHLVGLGKEFVRNVRQDPTPAVEIANSYSYVESFKYVLEGTRHHYSLGEYVCAFRDLGLFRDSPESPEMNTMFMLAGEVPAVAVRVGADFVFVVTPNDSRDLDRR